MNTSLYAMILAVLVIFGTSRFATQPGRNQIGEATKLMDQVTAVDEEAEAFDKIRNSVTSAILRLKQADPVALAKNQIEEGNVRYFAFEVPSGNSLAFEDADRKQSKEISVPGFKSRRIKVENCDFDFQSLGYRNTFSDKKCPQMDLGAAKHAFAWRYNSAIYSLADTKPDKLVPVDDGLTPHAIQTYLEVPDEQWNALSDVTKVRIRDLFLARNFGG
jgi:hypothetical protein